MPTNPISPLPTPPSRNDDPDTFVTRSDAFVGALPVFVSQTNQLAGDIETDADLINSAIETAQTAAGNASGSADNAAASATAAGISEDNAEIFAAAAQAAIGVPSLVGNALEFLQVNPAEDGVRFARAIYDLNHAYQVKTDTASNNVSTAFSDTGLNASITPRYASSKILLISAITVGSNASNTSSVFKFQNGTTDIVVGDAQGSRVSSQFTGISYSSFQTTTVIGMAIDTPASILAQNYKVVWRSGNTSGSAYINRSGDDLDDDSGQRSVSTFFALELPQ